MGKRQSDQVETKANGSGSQLAKSSGSSSIGAGKDELVETVNAMHSAEFKKRYIDNDSLVCRHTHETTTTAVTLEFKSSTELTEEELASCFALIETTSRADYEPSSLGWHPKRKRREMLEEEMKYLLVRRTADGAIDGFLSFMITQDSVPSVPVLYIYEIHLDEKVRKTGLGSHLMRLAEDTAVRVGVQKVMLTCFLSNENARKFYGKQGYENDVCSPDDRKTRKKVVRVDYVIMSKRMTKDPTNDNG